MMISTTADQPTFISPSGVPVPGLERLSSFWRSVEGIKSWLDNFHQIPPAKCVGLPSHFWAQTIWCNAILKHLSTTQTHPDRAALGDCCRAVRHRVDLLSTLDWMVAKLDEVSDEVDGGIGNGNGTGGGDSLFKVFSRLFGRARVWAEARWDVVPSSSSQGQEEHCASHDGDGWYGSHGFGMGNGGVPDVEDISWMHAMDLENDSWFENVLGWSPANA
jgi:hypothetical protein